jgi:hypothetical protein
MNKIIREKYPVSSLPEDLRQGLEPSAYVRVVIEGVEAVAVQKARLAELLKSARQSKPLDSDPVARIRKLRDEWDD